MNAFLQQLVQLLTTLAGGYAISELAPPAHNEVAVRVFLLGLAAGLWGLAWLVTRHWGRIGRRRYLKRVTMILSVCLFLMITSGVTFLMCHSAWTVEYQGASVIIGTERTAKGQSYFDATDSTPEQAVMDNAGESEGIWTAASIHSRLVWLWVLHLPFFSGAVFVILMVWHLLGAQRE